MTNNLTKARHLFQQEGPVSLISRTGDHIKYRLWRDIIVPVCQSVISEEKLIKREQLREISDVTIPVGQQETFELNTPNFHSENHDKITNRVGSHFLEQPFVCEISNARLVGDRALTLTADGRYVLENSRNYPRKLIEDLTKSLRPALSSRPDQIINHGVSLVGPYHTGYYHWFVDYLSRLQGVKEYEKTAGKTPTILIPPNMPKWKKDSLKLLNYWDHCSVLNGDTVQVKKLVIPTMAHGGKWGLLLSPSRLNWIRTEITNSVEQSNSGYFSKYIYISRNDADTRKVRNESEVLEELPDEFESHELSSMQLVDQIKLFSNAEMVVAPHGAGLTNMLWGTNLDILELRRARDPDCYFQMASALDHTYGYVRCKEEDRDIIVNIDELGSYIRKYRKENNYTHG